jgi:hypothetical protein
MKKDPTAGFFQPCPHCNNVFHVRSKICPKCGNGRADPIAEVQVLAPPVREPEPEHEHAPEDSVVSLLTVITPEPVAEEKEPVYVAMRAFMCRVGDTLVQMKEGQQLTDRRAIKILLDSGQPIAPAEDAEGFMTCPCCAKTFRPTPAQLAIANATSVITPTRAA